MIIFLKDISNLRNIKIPNDHVLSSIPPSRAISLQATSYPPTSRSASPTVSTSATALSSDKPGKLLTFDLTAVINVLQIDATLTRQHSQNNQDLKDQYRRYSACLKALDKLGGVNWTEVAWNGPKPAQKDIIELFISKTQFYKTWRPLFGQVIQHYDGMAKWLEGASDAPSAKRIWGVGKAKYDFSDLEKWLKLEGTLNGNVEREVRTGDSGEGAGKKKKKKKKTDSVSPSKK